MADDVEVPRKKGRDPILMFGTIILTLAFVVVISGYAYGEIFGTDHDEPAKYGDRVKVDYVGSFYGWYVEHDGVDPGMVFDTSMWSVASNGSIPKSWGFTEKKEEQYVPFNVTIGSGGALADFERALIGMKPGETKWIIIENGYGEVPEAQEKTWTSMTTIIGCTETMSVAEFRETFGLANAAPAFYSDLEHPYGWTSQAVFNSDGTVTVTHLVENGKTYNANDNKNMQVKVTSLSATEFTIEFIFVDPVFINGSGPTGKIQLIEFKFGGETLYVTEITTGGFITKSSRELVGMDLYFMITFIGYQ